MLYVRDLCFEYSDKRVLFNLSFDIKEGTITALVGPNGAGKTTLIRCLTALSKPYSGSVHLDDLDIHMDPILAHSRMGYLADFFGLYDALTVYRCLLYAAASQGIPEKERDGKIRFIAERMGLSERLDDLAGDLSRGQKQRLGIAQSLIHGPKIAVLDEPASGLDPDARQELSILMRQLKDQGMTLVVSSHILSELEDYATDLLVLKEGRIVSHGPLSGKEKDAQAATFYIHLAAYDPKIKEVLASFPDVTFVRQEKDFIYCQMAKSSHEKQRALLEKLVEEGFAVLEFFEEKSHLKERYMTSMHPGETKHVQS